MNAAARLVEVRVPDMGNFKDVAVIDVLVKPGEKHRAGSAARHSRNREGDDGCAVHRRWGHREDPRRQGRDGLARGSDRDRAVDESAGAADGVAGAGCSGGSGGGAAAWAAAASAAVPGGSGRLRRRCRSIGAASVLRRTSASARWRQRQDRPQAAPASARLDAQPQRPLRLPPLPVWLGAGGSCGEAAAGAATAAASRRLARSTASAAARSGGPRHRPSLGGIGLAAHQRAWLLARARRPVGAQVCARAGRRPDAGEGQRLQGPHHP